MIDFKTIKPAAITEVRIALQRQVSDRLAKLEERTPGERETLERLGALAIRLTQAAADAIADDGNDGEDRYTAIKCLIACDNAIQLWDRHIADPSDPWTNELLKPFMEATHG